MIGFRWSYMNGARVLQVRHLFTPCRIASGDIVLFPVADPKWESIPTEDFLTAEHGQGALPEVDNSP